MGRLNLRKSLTWALVFGILISGCAGTYGSLKHNKALMADYHGKKLPLELNYYYCGRSSIPYAVVGIDKFYTFESKFWFKIESQDDLYDKIRNLSDLEPSHSKMYAKDILDTEGRSIGIWFSFYNTTPVTVDGENRVIEVFNPYKPSSRFSSE